MSFLGKAMVMKNLEESAAVRGARRLATHRGNSGRFAANAFDSLFTQGAASHHNPAFMARLPRQRQARLMGQQIRASKAAALRVPNPGRSRFSLAKHGKYVAAGVVGAGGVGAMMKRTGPGVDKTQGRPTGMYGY